jgi:hypothetical protein
VDAEQNHHIGEASKQSPEYERFTSNTTKITGNIKRKKKD